MEFVVVTGMSGAGKSKAIEVLEDIGYFCVDNVPPVLLEKFAELSAFSSGSIDRMAVVVDSRGRSMFSAFLSSLDALTSPYRLLFLDAGDEVLLRRFKEGRRKHPLLGEGAGSIDEAIAMERELLTPAKDRADYVVDTSYITSMQLKERIVSMFMPDERASMPVHCMSFGFKNGLPGEADMVFDVRCLPNPFYVAELKEKTGLEDGVYSYVMNSPDSHRLQEKIFDMVDFLIPLFRKEGKSQLVIAVGCTGGKHRSVVFAEALGRHLRENNVGVIIAHRDINKQNHGQR